MALEIEAAPRPSGSPAYPRTAALAVGDGSGRPLTGPFGGVPDFTVIHFVRSRALDAADVDLRAEDYVNDKQRR